MVMTNTRSDVGSIRPFEGEITQRHESKSWTSEKTRNPLNDDRMITVDKNPNRDPPPIVTDFRVKVTEECSEAI
jgi:hypothetical protein